MGLLRLLLFVVVGLGSLVALLFLLPWLKEGFGVEVSALQGKPDEWRRMIDRLEPASLEAAGYRRCTPVQPGSFESCYCPPVSSPRR
jgi:hypothetical protein